jgi:chromosome transmission fidelity protein 4
MLTCRTAIALSTSFVICTTTASYVRIYTLFGTPYRIYRLKSHPCITTSAWRDYLFTLSNGPLSATGRPTIVYTLENLRRDEVYQSNDFVALGEAAGINAVMFTDQGDPCVYDSTGVLLVLQHWRIPGQARWVPLLDTKWLERLRSGRKSETYWPVAVAGGKFHCIILKGGDRHPYFPRPILSEFEFKIPVSGVDAPKAKAGKAVGDGDDDDDALAAAAAEGPRLEETFVRQSLLLSLFSDTLTATHATHAQRSELARMEIEVDKTLLQLLNVECREGEERGMKALEIVGLLRDATDRMVEAAGKVAARYGRGVLEDKIRELAEKKLLGEGGEGDDDDDDA